MQSETCSWLAATVILCKIYGVVFDSCLLVYYCHTFKMMVEKIKKAMKMVKL